MLCVVTSQTVQKGAVPNQQSGKKILIRLLSNGEISVRGRRANHITGEENMNESEKADNIIRMCTHLYK